MSASTATAMRHSPNLAAFVSVQILAAELSKGTIDLPSFPEIVVRVRKALDDPNCSAERIAALVGAEPMLAAHLMVIANSAAFMQLGKPLADLRSAVIRLGSNMVRGVAIAFAIAQLRNQAALKPIVKPLGDLWRESTHVAAIASVLAKRAGINPDEAFLVGLLHTVGKLYVLTRAASQRELFQRYAGLEGIVQGWHANIAKAILENWSVSEVLIEAVAVQDEWERKHYGGADLADVLIAAKVLALHGEDPAALMYHVDAIDAFRQLGLDAAACVELLGSAAERVGALREALGK